MKKQIPLELRCTAIVMDAAVEDGNRRCYSGAKKGSHLCSKHQAQRNWLDRPSKGFVITLNVKPAEQYYDPRWKSFHYRKFCIGRKFNTEQEAWEYARILGTRIWDAAPGRKVNSYSVERIR